jgi:magnesium chelatase subunit I
VSLLSVLQEGKFTTGAYPIVFKPDVRIIATANPIDYTHSGKIIEPLFDRLRSHIDIPRQ